jgi:hypothetical protein
MGKVPGSVYDKWDISVVICDTDIPMEQEVPTRAEHLSSPPVLVGFVLLDLWFDICVL